jgi:hypothetical protein
MIRERGRIYGAIVTRRLRAMGIQASRASYSDRMSVPGLISDVVGFMRKIVLTIAVERSGARTEPQLHTSIIWALNVCIDERIEPLSPDKLRDIVTLNVRAGAA